MRREKREKEGGEREGRGGEEEGRAGGQDGHKRQRAWERKGKGRDRGGLGATRMRVGAWQDHAALQPPSQSTCSCCAGLLGDGGMGRQGWAVGAVIEAGGRRGRGRANLSRKRPCCSVSGRVSENEKIMDRQVVFLSRENSNLHIH